MLRLHKCYLKTKQCPHCSFECDRKEMMNVHIQREHTENPIKFSCYNYEVV